MKKLGIVVLAVVLAIGGALWWLRGNLDGLVKQAVMDYGSRMTGARVDVAAVEIGAADGRGVIRGLTLGNPPGFGTAHAMKVGEIELVVDVASVAKDVVVIRKIAVLAPDIIYEKGAGPTNFDAIQQNIAAYVGPSKQESGGKKLIVEEFTVRNAKAQASAAFMGGKTVAVSLPDIVLRDLGKAKGGVTPGELGQEIAAVMKQRLTAAVSFDSLSKSAGKSLESAGSAVKGLFGK